MGLFSFSQYIINSKNLINNLNIIRDKLNKGVKLCAVLKADAYGVGVGNVINTLNQYSDCYAVANLEEGIELRNLGVDKEILVLSALNFDYLNLYQSYNLTPPVSSVCEMSKLSSGAKAPIKVEFALNTGMNRIGFVSNNDILKAVALKNQNGFISVFGVFSHLATKENDINFMLKQKHCFDDYLLNFKDQKITRHIANTNATLNHCDFQYDMVRVGFGLYGMDINSHGLKPVVSVVSKIVLINCIKAGESVGYDRMYIAKNDMRVAVVPLGYYDGINRRLSGNGKVIVNGEYANIIGRICMDNFMIDITHIHSAEVGSEVVIIGCHNGKAITLKEHAQIVDTSEYDILSNLNQKRMQVLVE